MENSKFNDLYISNEILLAIKDMGFEEPTPIQAQSIPHMLTGKDLVGQAQTGTGKTAAFGIATLEKIDQGNRALQAVILCPTRELAIQVSEELKMLSKYQKAVRILPVYGGQPIDRQIKVLKKGVQVVIGTPGRIMDHMKRRTLKMDSVRIIILDEADEMLDMGFRDDIEHIVETMPQQRQTILFSATMSKAILNLAKKYQNDPQMVKLVHKEMTVPNVEQYYYEVKQHAKSEVLCRLMDLHNFNLSLVFCNTKKRVDELVEDLKTKGYLAEGLHGDMQQNQRDRVMSRFRSGDIEVLVATDVAARGIDVGATDAVFNFDMPADVEYYVHRIGRTARAGKAGYAFTFVTGREVRRIKGIQKFTGTKIKSQVVPSISDVNEVRINQLLTKVKETIDAGHLASYSNLVEKLIQEDYAYFDVAAALMKMVVGDSTRK